MKSKYITRSVDITKVRYAVVVDDEVDEQMEAILPGSDSFAEIYSYISSREGKPIVIFKTERGRLKVRMRVEDFISFGKVIEESSADETEKENV